MIKTAKIKLNTTEKSVAPEFTFMFQIKVYQIETVIIFDNITVFTVFFIK